mmetsp:Transcript_93950/g.265332  ORF Transcript_93950/g.265332 Transcript_93950/m.265332 type:complete len:243 (-) Transcript_93950:85-813(-)
MAYGPLCQCAFMSYGPRIQQKAPAIKQTRQLYDKLPPFEPPPGCEAPPPGAFMLLAVDIPEAKENPNSPNSSLELEDKCLVFGSAQDYDGLVYDGHKGVAEQHACLYHKKGKWFVRAINGTTYLESMTLHPYLRDPDGKPPKRYVSNNKKIEQIQPMDGKRQLSREICCIRLGDSTRRFWISGPLPLKDGEVEEGGTAERGDRKKDRHEKDAKDKKGRREKERERSPSQRRSRSRSEKRRRR